MKLVTEKDQKRPQVGQIGLTTEGLAWAAVLARYGNSVLCSDADEETVNGIMEGVMPGEAFGLAAAVEEAVASKMLSLIPNPRSIYRSCRVIFISGMVPLKDDGRSDIRFIETIVRQAAYQVTEDTVLVIRPVMMPDTFEALREKAEAIGAEREDGVRVQLCLMPEYHTTALIKTLSMDGVLLIGCDGKAPDALSQILKQLPNGSNRMIVVTPKEAAISAYAAAGLSAVRQTYYEEMMRFCRANGASASVVASVIHLLDNGGSSADVRWKQGNIGAGFGGTHIFREINEMIATGKAQGTMPAMMVAAAEQRDRQLLHRIACLKKEIHPKGKTVAVLGLAPVADTDDLRNTPALEIVRALIAAGASVRLYMPCGEEQAKWRFYKERDSITFCHTPAEASMKADVAVVLGKWRGMNRFLTGALPKRMKGKQIYDIVCGLDRAKVIALGLEYHY